MAKKIDVTGFDDAVKQYDLSGFDASAAPAEVSGPSQLESLGLGAAQGVTMGFADEGEAALLSALGQGSYEDLLNTARTRYKVAEETNPWTYAGGNLVSGLAVPGLGAVGTVGKALPQIGRMALAGAGAGALTSLGTREDDKLSKQAAIDALEGAAIGGGVSAALGSAVPAITKSIAKKYGKSQNIKDIGEVFSKIRSGQVDTFDENFAGEVSDKIRQAAKTDILGNVDKLEETAGENLNYLRKLATEQGAPIEIAPRVAEMRMRMPGQAEGVTDEMLNPIQRNFERLLGEQEVTKTVAKPLDPLEAEAKVMDSLRKRAAQQEARAEREYARAIIRSRFEDNVADLGLDQGTKSQLVKERMMSLTNEDIDKVVDEVRALGMRERTAFPPEFEVNPETGLNVGIVKRSDADTTMSVPDTKLEKVKTMEPTRTAVPPKELSEVIRTINTLVEDSKSSGSADLYRYSLSVKKELEQILNSNMPDKWVQAKKLADEAYKNSKYELQGHILRLPEDRGTSYQGQMNQKAAIEKAENLIEKYSETGSKEGKNLNEFFAKLKGMNAEEAGLSTSGAASSGNQAAATVDDIQKNVYDLSRNLALANKATGSSGLQGSTGGMRGLLNMAAQQSKPAVTLQWAESAGKTAQKYDRTMAAMKNATPDFLLNMASKVNNSKLSQLLQRIANAPEAKRKAMLFSLMQQPAYRESINDLDLGD